MKYEIEVPENGHMTLKKDGEIVLITQYKTRLADIIADFIMNDGKSPLLEPKDPDITQLFNF